MLNPLIDDIFELILTKKVWKVHTLALELAINGVISTLDADPQRDLFKRNFLIMNALFQLQQQLAPSQYLQIASLHIELHEGSGKNQLSQTDALRDYYLEWKNYDTSAEKITAMLDDFWQKLGSMKQRQPSISLQTRQSLLREWQLDNNATLKMIQKRWRQLAFQHHPDKSPESEELFKKFREQYEQLRASCSVNS